jgi:hypothetical protein
MKIAVKCIANVWDSKKCFMFYAGQTYQIDEDEPILNMLTVPWDASPVDENGEPCVPLPKPPYAFQFDRAASKANAR